MVVPGRTVTGGGTSSRDPEHTHSVPGRDEPARLAEPKPRAAPDAATRPWDADPAGDPWAKVVATAAMSQRMRVLVNGCSLVKAEEDLVVLCVSEALLSAARASEKELCSLLAGAWDRAVRVELRPASAVEPSGPTPQPPPAEPAGPIAEHPLVKRAMEQFNAKLVGIQPRKPS
ncbi:hypothetical protein PHYC_03290 [Phycisphaerales bacterium]|nr:hypothetical protein PHYC_03290 [Phycisphaerales bacterium]